MSKHIIWVILFILLLILASKGIGIWIEYHFQNERLKIERESSQARDKLFKDFIQKMNEIMIDNFNQSLEDLK